MRRIALTILAAALAVALVATAAVARNGDRGGHKAFLNGYNEVVGGPGASTGSVSSTGIGRLTLRVEGEAIRYRLRYSMMEGGTVVAAHIHFAQRHVGGGIIADLCGGNEAPCTTPSGDISGTITPAEIKGPADQGIEPGSFAEAVRAIRAGATYANVHSTPRFPEGEIRGQIDRGHKRGRGNKD